MCSRSYKAPAAKPLPQAPPAANPGAGAPVIDSGYGIKERLGARRATNSLSIPFVPAEPPKLTGPDRKADPEAYFGWLTGVTSTSPEYAGLSKGDKQWHARNSDEGKATRSRRPGGTNTGNVTRSR